MDIHGSGVNLPGYFGSPEVCWNREHFHVYSSLSRFLQDFKTAIFKPGHLITLLRNYWKSKVKQEWLNGKYSNIQSSSSLPETSMYPMDADTWGEILKAELER
ncbi:F-box only protein 48 [Alligator mississippiensis]|uniref:F-box only protein 48 n=1 Tax=Alligator mississippiensis TaxID=8496 RepID=A0A151MGT5_ALLMI|nr:F-box only protein 48 [Alligator mississippiensis]